MPSSNESTVERALEWQWASQAFHGGFYSSYPALSIHASSEAGASFALELKAVSWLQHVRVVVRHRGQEKSPPGATQPAEPEATRNTAAFTHGQPKVMEARTAVTEGCAHLYYPEEFSREVTLQEKQPPRGVKRNAFTAILEVHGYRQPRKPPTSLF